MKKQTIFDNMNYIARNEINNLVSRIAPYSYWFQKVTGEPLYTEADIQEILRQWGSPTQRAPDRLVAEGTQGIFAKFVEFSKRLLARIGGS